MICFPGLLVLKRSSTGVSDEPGGLAQTDAGARQAALSNGWLAIGDIFLCEKFTFVPVE